MVATSGWSRTPGTGNYGFSGNPARTADPPSLLTRTFAIAHLVRWVHGYIAGEGGVPLLGLPHVAHASHQEREH